MLRADSGWPGGGQQEAVGEEEDRKEREGDSSSSSSTSSSVIISRVIDFRSGIQREGGEVELTSSTSWRSVRAYYHILPVKAFNGHIYAIKGALMHLNYSWKGKKF